MRKSSLTLALVLSTTVPASAVTLHNAGATARCNAVINSNTETLSTTSLSFGAGAGDENCGTSSKAFSGGGTTRVHASISNTAFDDLNLSAGSAKAGAWISYSFTIKTLVGQPTIVPFSVNLHSSGSASAFSNKYISDQGQFLNSGQVISAGIRAFGSLGVNGQAQTFEERASVRVVPGESKTEGLSGNFTTPTIMVEAGDLISLSFGLDAGTSGQLIGTSANGTVNASNSLSFAIAGDVFNLPDGYKVDIDETRIVNNRYTPPPPLVSPVPLPAAGFTLVYALGALAALRRRH